MNPYPPEHPNQVHSQIKTISTISPRFPRTYNTGIYPIENQEQRCELFTNGHTSPTPKFWHFSRTVVASEIFHSALFFNKELTSRLH